MAIQFAVQSGPVFKRDGRRICRRSRQGTRSARSHTCPDKRRRTTQGRSASHSGNNYNRLVIELLPLVRRVALHMRCHLPAYVEVDDLVSEGVVGLIDALRKFDSTKGVSIESYARHRIRGAILDSLREQDHASRDMRKRMKKVESAGQNLEFHLRRPAGDAEMAEALGLPLPKWYERVAELQRLGFDGSGAKIPLENRKRISEEELAASTGDDPFTLCYRREQKEILSRALVCLTDRERSIVTSYYKDCLTMKQIGSRLGIDESRVSQLHSGALVRLRARVAAMLDRPAPLPGRAWPQQILATQA